VIGFLLFAPGVQQLVSQQEEAVSAFFVCCVSAVSPGVQQLGPQQDASLVVALASVPSTCNAVPA